MTLPTGCLAAASNRVELALGPDADGDGTLGDHEAPFVLAVDCGRVVVREADPDPHLCPRPQLL